MQKYVYLIFATESGDYKIGVSKNPRKRVRQLQTGNSEPLVLLDTFLTSYYLEVEKSLHGLFAPSRKIGEWFYIGLGEIGQFQRRCREMENFYRIQREYEVEL